MVFTIGVFVDSRSELNNHGSGGGGSVSGDVAAAKIIELSKKIREMTAELHKEQNKSKQYAKQVKLILQQKHYVN